MRRSQRDVLVDRQRTLFGVDRLERMVADMGVELLRMHTQCVALGVSRETHSAHIERIKAWLLLYTEIQRSDFELGADEKAGEEVSNATPTK